MFLRLNGEDVYQSVKIYKLGMFNCARHASFANEVWKL